MILGMIARCAKSARCPLLAPAFAIAVGGCVTLTPQQQDTVAEVQRFADATAAAYNLPRIGVTVEPDTNLNIGGRYRQGNFYLNVQALGSWGLTVLVAHELAHYVLGHDSLQASSMAELQRAHELRELDANAKAVEILMRVKGMNQTRAVQMIVTYLRGAQQAIERGTALTQGHRPPSAEIADLLERFPGARTPVVVREASSDLIIETPSWRPGYSWEFRWESSTGAGTYVSSLDREETIDDVLHYVIKVGKRETFYRKSDLAVTRETLDGAPALVYTPSRLRYPWPLAVGKTCEVTFQEERPAARQTTERSDVITVEAEENVTVPAGTFRTLKLVGRRKASNALRYEEWFSPDLKQWVLVKEYLESGLRVRELIGSSLASDQARGRD